MKQVFLRGARWHVRHHATFGNRIALRMEDPETGETIEALCPRMNSSRSPNRNQLSIAVRSRQ